MSKPQTPLSHQRISKILDLSMDYKRHREMLREIQNKSEKCDYKKRTDHLDLLIEQRNRYKNAVKRQSQLKLRKQNSGLVLRLAAITQRPSSKTSLTRTNSVSSLKSLQAPHSSNNNPTKKFETQLQKKLIQKKPIKLSHKLQKSQLRLLIPSKQQIKLHKQYKQSLRKFSQKNKNIRTSILQKGLKLQKQYMMFLPNLRNNKKQKSRSQTKI